VAVGELDGEGGVGDQHGGDMGCMALAEGDLLPGDDDHTKLTEARRRTRMGSGEMAWRWADWAGGMDYVA
jgi:hypothetical protein